MWSYSHYIAIAVLPFYWLPFCTHVRSGAVVAKIFQFFPTGHGLAEFISFVGEGEFFSQNDNNNECCVAIIDSYRVGRALSTYGGSLEKLILFCLSSAHEKWHDQGGEKTRGKILRDILFFDNLEDTHSMPCHTMPWSDIFRRARVVYCTVWPLEIGPV